MATNHPLVEAVNSTFLTKEEAAQLIGSSRRYIERQIRAGRLRALKPTARLVRIRRRDLEEFLESGATMRGDQ